MNRRAFLKKLGLTAIATATLSGVLTVRKEYKSTKVKPTESNVKEVKNDSLNITKDSSTESYNYQVYNVGNQKIILQNDPLYDN